MLLKITYEMLYFEVFGRHKRQRVCFMFLRPDSTLFWKFYTCLRTLIAMPANCSTKLTRHDFNLFSQCLSLIFFKNVFSYVCCVYYTLYSMNFDLYLELTYWGHFFRLPWDGKTVTHHEMSLNLATCARSALKMRRLVTLWLVFLLLKRLINRKNKECCCFLTNCLMHLGTLC